MLVEVSVPSDFGLNNAKIKKMSTYQGRKNEVKKSWNLKNAKIVSVIIREMGMLQNLKEIIKNYPWEYYCKPTAVGSCPGLI